MPVFLECVSVELKALLHDISMTPATKHFLRLAPECESGRDLMLKAGKMPSKMKMADDPDEPKAKKKKRKKSGYNVFIGECIKERGSNPVSEQMKVCGPKWKGLPEEQKKRYTALAAES